MSSQEKFGTFVVTVALVIGILWGISAVRRDRVLNTACWEKGGQWTYLSGHKVCARVTVEPIPIEIP